MAFKIYTKTGDKGQTSLLGGKRVPKNHHQIECYGTIDELNSQLGFIVSQVEAGTTIIEELQSIQSLLFLIGSYLAKEKESKFELPPLQEKAIEKLEERIDAMEKELSPLKNFILPGGSVLASATHVARCICRRAERLCIQLQSADKPEIDFIIKYLNRLSDYLFVLARYFNFKSGTVDIIWKSQ